MSDGFQLASDEIVRLHEFLGAWFRGELGEEQFAPGFADVLHADFENVQPAGIILTRADILTMIADGKGSNPDFRITIERPRLLGSWPGFLLFQYVEHQTGARHSAPENRRLSTVLFERVDQGLSWRYLVEVGLDS